MIGKSSSLFSISHTNICLSGSCYHTSSIFIVADDIGSNIEDAQAATAQGKSQLMKASKDTDKVGGRTTRTKFSSKLNWTDFLQPSIYKCHVSLFKCKGHGIFRHSVMCMRPHCQHVPLLQRIVQQGLQPTLLLHLIQGVPMRLEIKVYRLYSFELHLFYLYLVKL